MGNKPARKLSPDSNRVKFLLIGKNFVGKTSLLARYQYGEFLEEYKQSVGCSLSTFPMLFQNLECQLMVLDSLSDSDFSLDCRLKSISNANIIGLVFDLNDLHTWRDIPAKLQKIQENNYKNSQLLLIGAKSDLDKQVSMEEIKKFQDDVQSLKIEYIETSAKSDENIEALFVKALAMGIPQSFLKWSRVQGLLFAHKYALSEDHDTEVSWMNLCEALPNMFQKKKTKESIVARMDANMLETLCGYL